MNAKHLTIESIHKDNKLGYYQKFSFLCFSLSLVFAILNIFTKFYVAVTIDLIAALVFYILYFLKGHYHQKPYLGSILIITCCLQLLAQTIILDPGTHHNLVFFPAVAIFVFTLTDSRKRILSLISFCAFSLVASHLIPYYFETSFIPLSQTEKHFYMIACGIATLYATFMIGKSLIDEKMKAIKELKLITEQLDNMTSRYEKLIEVAIHDIASPLTVMKLKVKQHKGSIPEDIRDSLNVQIDKLTELIHDTRIYYNSEKNNVTISKEKIDINKVIIDSLSSFEEMITLKNLEVKQKYNSSSLIYANYSFLKSSVISNFISNAIKFSQENSFFEIETNENDNSVILMITNFGQGITDDKIENIIRGDKNESTLGTKGEAGQGLGLGIATHFIKQFQGHIECEAEKDTYTRFLIYFPKLKR